MLETKLENYDDKELILSNGIIFKSKTRFSLLHTSVLYDKQLENIRKAFNTKYGIDYLSIFGMGTDSKKDQIPQYWIGNLPHAKWRDCIIKNDFDTDDPIVLLISELKKGQGRLIFPDVAGYRGFSLRGDMIGEYKNPFDICIYSNNSKIRWGFSITLKGLASILSISYETYVQLRRDLQKIEPFLMPFYDYFKEFGSITDTPELKQKLKDHNFDFQI